MRRFILAGGLILVMIPVAFGGWLDDAVKNVGEGIGRRAVGDAGSGARLPWHRVLRADGRFAFTAGSRGFREQRARLVEEGVVVTNGRVDLRRFGWGRDLDAELWAPGRT